MYQLWNTVSQHIPQVFYYGLKFDGYSIILQWWANVCNISGVIKFIEMKIVYAGCYEFALNVSKNFVLPKLNFIMEHPAH